MALSSLRLHIPCARNSATTSTTINYLDLDVANFGSGTDDGPAHHGGEDVGGEVGACIATLHKLWGREHTTHVTSGPTNTPVSVSGSLACDSLQLHSHVPGNHLMVDQLTPVPLSQTITLFPFESVISETFSYRAHTRL